MDFERGDVSILCTIVLMYYWRERKNPGSCLAVVGVGRATFRIKCMHLMGGERGGEESNDQITRMYGLRLYLIPDRGVRGFDRVPWCTLKWRPDGFKVGNDGVTEDGITIMSRSRRTEDWSVHGYRCSMA